MDESPSNVAILQCHIEGSTVIQGNDSDEVVREVRGIRVAFRNNGTADLTHVKFVVEQDGQRVVLDAFGRFSPGVLIEHYFDARELSFDEPVCSVAPGAAP